MKILSWASLGLTLALLSGLSGLAKAEPNSETPPSQISVEETEDTEESTLTSLLYVNPEGGNDYSGDGSESLPFKTITQALQVAQPNTTIMLAPGTYQVEMGETFPLQLKPGVTLQGDPTTQGKTVVIRGGGEFLSPTAAAQTVTIVGSDDAGLVGITVTNPYPRGVGLWIESTSPLVTDSSFVSNRQDGIAIAGNSTSILRGNIFAQNGNSGLSIAGTAKPQVQDNTFSENSSTGMAISQNSAPLIQGNRFRNNRDGLIIQGKAQPILRSNKIESNAQNGILVLGEARPNLGDSTAANQIQGNRQANLNTRQAKYKITAIANSGTGTASPRPNRSSTLRRPRNPQTAIAQKPGQPQTRRPVPAPTSRAVNQRTVAALPVARSIPPSPKQPIHPNSTSPLLGVAGQTASLSMAPPASPITPPASLITPPASPTTSPASQPRVITLPSAVVLANWVGESFPREAGRSAKAMGIQVTSPEIALAPAPVPTPEVKSAPSKPITPLTTGQLAPTPPKSEPLRLPPTPAPIPTPAAPQAESARPAIVKAPVTPPKSEPSRLPIANSPVTPTETPKVANSPIAPTETTKVAVRTSDPAVPSVALPVPVPPPPTNRSAPVSPRKRNTPPVRAALKSAGLLPVPGPSIPVGEGGERSFARILPATPGSPPPPPVEMATASIPTRRYRVIVEAEDEARQSTLRKLAPNAFRTVSRGRIVMQVGIFNDRARATQFSQSLVAQGLNATVERLR